MLNNKVEENEKSYFIDIFFCLLALVAMAVYYYGHRVLIVTFISVATCYLTDFACAYLRTEKYVFKDYSSITGGLILALLMPASAPYGLVIISALIVTIIGKQAFGGNENLIFHPVAVGYAIATLCWSKVLLMYPTPSHLGKLSFASQIADTQSHSLTYSLNMGNIPFIYNFDIVLGKFIGPMGTTHIVILLVCAICLMFRKSASFLTVLSAFLTLILGALISPLVYGASIMTSIIFELITGSTIFVLIFMLCDYKISPKTKTGKLIYGVIFALITLFFRRFAQLEQASIFAVLLSNVLVSTTDEVGVLIKKFLRQAGKLSAFVGKKTGVFVLFIIKKLWYFIKKFFVFLFNKIKNTKKSEIIIIPDIEESTPQDEETLYTVVEETEVKISNKTNKKSKKKADNIEVNIDDNNEQENENPVVINEESINSQNEEVISEYKPKRKNTRKKKNPNKDTSEEIVETSNQEIKLEEKSDSNEVSEENLTPIEKKTTKRNSNSKKKKNVSENTSEEIDEKENEDISLEIKVVNDEVIEENSTTSAKKPSKKRTNNKSKSTKSNDKITLELSSSEIADSDNPLSDEEKQLVKSSSNTVSGSKKGEN